MNEDANPYVGRSSSGALQVRKRRRDGWTRRDEDAFFKFYRINCNVSASWRRWRRQGRSCTAI